MLKRLFDLTASVAGLAFMLPFFVLLAILIKLDSPGPVFFRQKRVGKNQKPFKIFKFRTMQTHQPDKAMQITVGADARITRVGHVLRRYKIDELPQLINVALGQMSLVGPRPEVPEYVAYYSPKSKEIVFSARPGITDLASVKFRDESTILARSDNPEHAYIHKVLPKKLALCRYYVKHQSLCFDMAIIFKTLKAVM